MIYDRFAKLYDKMLDPFEKLFLDKWRSETLSKLPKNAKILELGAGTGLNFKHYPNCKHAVASELSAKMLEIAKGRNTQISLAQADAEDLPFPDNYFDAAFATLVYCSIPSPEKAFAELQRILKPTDKIILLEHVRPTGLLGYFFDVLNLFTVALIDDHFNRETAKLAKDAGLNVVSVEKKVFGVVNLITLEVK